MDPKIFALLATIINGVAYSLYGKQVKNGSSEPNPASWALWAFIAGGDSIAYFIVSGDWFASSTLFVDFIACLAIFIYIWVKNRSFSLTTREKKISLLVVIAMLVCWVFHDAPIASIMLCIASYLSFQPAIEGMEKEKKKEAPLAWCVSTCAYSFMLLNVVFKNGGWVEYAAPAVLFYLHAEVAYIAIKQRTKNN